MAKTQKARLYLRHDGTTYSFLSAELNPGSDGTLLLSMVREGETDSSIEASLNLDNGEVSVAEPTKSPKGFRVTYHSSGQINFHHLSAPPIFMKPLSHITQTEPLIDISIPNVKSLDQTQKIKKDAAILDVASGRLTFTVQVTPWDSLETGLPLLWAWTWRPLFALKVLVAPNPPKQILEALPKHFHYIARRQGLFADLQLSEEDAKVAFHKALNKTEGDVLYPPDGEGNCRIVFVTPMRIVPDVEIGFRDPTLTAEIIKVTTTEMRYRAHDGKQQLVRDMRAIDIIHHVRSAEL